MQAAPDGATLGMGAPSTLAVNPALLPQQPYDVQRDLAPVVQLLDVALAVVVNPALPVRDMADLVAYLRAHPGTPFASAGPATTPHIAAELFAQRLGLSMQHVPYRGSGPAMGDLLAGNIGLMFDTVASAAPHAEAGRLRLLAVTSAARLTPRPDVPTVAETVSPGFEAVAWGGVAGMVGAVDRCPGRFTQKAFGPERRARARVPPVPHRGSGRSRTSPGPNRAPISAAR